MDGSWASCTVLLASEECRWRSDRWSPSALEFWFCDSFNKYWLSTCYCPGTGDTAWTPNQSERQIRVNTMRTVFLNATILISFLQFSSVAQSCPTLCGRMDCSRPGFPVHHQLLEIAQTHVHQVSDAIQGLNLCLFNSLRCKVRLFEIFLIF